MVSSLRISVNLWTLSIMQMWSLSNLYLHNDVFPNLWAKMAIQPGAPPGMSTRAEDSAFLVPTSFVFTCATIHSLTPAPPFLNICTSWLDCLKILKSMSFHRLYLLLFYILKLSIWQFTYKLFYLCTIQFIYIFMKNCYIFQEFSHKSSITLCCDTHSLCYLW